MRNFQGRHVAVLGTLGAGIATVEYLARQGAKVTLMGVCSEVAEPELRQALAGVNVDYCLGEAAQRKNLKTYDGIVLTPGGGRLFSTQVEAAREAGVSVLTDLDLALSQYRAPLIAVTGSNGKSTVLYLLKAIFQAAGKKVLAAGGEDLDFSASLFEMDKPDLILLELSSSRLDRVAKIDPWIGVLLNIYSGHSERHENFQAYAQAKAKIYRTQSENGYFLFPNSSVPVQRMLKDHPPAALQIPFSFQGPLQTGAWVDAKSKTMVFAAPDGTRSQLNYEKLNLSGTHHLENALVSFAIAKIAEVDDRVIAEVFKSITAPVDRMELLGKIEGVLYVNDAQASNPTATLSSLHGFADKSVLLIAGGEPSPHLEDPYLLEMIRRKVRVLALIGSKRRRLYKLWGECAETYVMPDLADAVEVIARLAQKGETVLFSPAMRPEQHVHSTARNRGESFRRAVAQVQELARARKLVERERI